MKENRNLIIGYCVYCHNPVWEEEDYRKKDDSVIHEGCYQISNTYTNDYGEVIQPRD